jgi:hypothetical protein
MAKLKSKYKRKESELIDSMIKSGTKTFITQITMVETSKMKGYQIYECKYVDGGAFRNVNIVAMDITDAVTKLESIVGMGVPEQTANYMLGSETLNKK